MDEAVTLACQGLGSLGVQNDLTVQTLRDLEANLRGEVHLDVTRDGLHGCTLRSSHEAEACGASLLEQHLEVLDKGLLARLQFFRAAALVGSIGELVEDDQREPFLAVFDAVVHVCDHFCQCTLDVAYFGQYADVIRKLGEGILKLGVKDGDVLDTGFNGIVEDIGEADGLAGASATAHEGVRVGVVVEVPEYRVAEVVQTQREPVSTGVILLVPRQVLRALLVDFNSKVCLAFVHYQRFSLQAYTGHVEGFGDVEGVTEDRENLGSLRDFAEVGIAGEPIYLVSDLHFDVERPENVFYLLVWCHIGMCVIKGDE